MREHKTIHTSYILLLIIQTYVLTFSFLCLAIVGANIELDFPRFIGLLCLTMLSEIFILKGRIKNLSNLCLFVIIVYTVIHSALFWILISPYKYKLTDARIFFVDKITDHGKIESLGNYAQTEGIYYTAYPSIWMIASFIKLICSTSSFDALTSAHLVTYLCLILFIYAFRRLIIDEKETDEEKSKKLDVSPFLIIILTSYTMQLMQFLTSANTLGVLGLTLLIVAFRLFLIYSESSKEYKIALLFLIVCIPLLISSPISLLTGYFTFLMSMLDLFVIKHDKKKLHTIVKAFFLLFVGTWLYLSIILPIFQISGAYHFLVLITEVLDELPLTRPSVGQSIREQALHFTYPYNVIITPLYYLIPLIIGFTSSISLFINKMINLRKLKQSISWEKSVLEAVFYMIVIQIQLFYISSIFIFGYKGIENALARYAHLYLTPFNTIMAFKLFYTYIKEVFISNSSRLPAILITLLMILIFQVINLEAFYTPFFSLIRIPDLYQFKHIFQIGGLIEVHNTSDGYQER
jgi:hypothetical protein